MTTIKCPICKDRIIGASTPDLNENLREHLADVHGMRELSSASAGGAPMGARSRERAYYPERPMGRPEEESVRGGDEREFGGPARNRVYRQVETGTYDLDDRSRLYRKVETGNYREPLHSGSPDTKRQIEEATRWERVGGRPGSEMAAERSYTVGRGGTVPREMERGGTGEQFTVSCPFCGDTIWGSNEDILSEELRNHMADVHHVTPKLTSRMER